MLEFPYLTSSIAVLNDGRGDVAIARIAGSDSLAGSAAGLAVALIPLAVVRLAADEGFVNLDNSAELGFGFDKAARICSPSAKRFDRTKTHVFGPPTASCPECCLEADRVKREAASLHTQAKFRYPRATKQPAGQITKNLSIPPAKNIPLNASGK